MILLLDNYDSFTYNIYQELSELGARVKVVRNDRITLKEVARLKPEKIVVSPGPGRPEKAGISVALIREYAGKVPLLGVCLGHQAIAYGWGGEIVRAQRLMHGKTSLVYHDERGLFRNIPNPFEATRYHSLIVKRDALPDLFEVTAWTGQEEIMGIKHKDFNLFGVQFHPESILTGEGINILRNFLAI